MKNGLETQKSSSPKRIYNKKEWKLKQPPYEVGKDGFGWMDIESDEDGWVDAARFRPFPYDLVKLQTHERVKSGWWTGQVWEGLKLDSDDLIYYWKHANDGR